MRKGSVSSQLLCSHQHHSDHVFLQWQFIQVAVLIAAGSFSSIPRTGDIVPLRDASTSCAAPLLRSPRFRLSDANLSPFSPAALTGMVASCGGCSLNLVFPWLFLQCLPSSSLHCPVKITYGFCLLTNLTDRALGDNPVQVPYFSDEHQSEKGQRISKVKT